MGGTVGGKGGEVPVVVVGGGPVGLSLALGLAHHGVRSVLVERDAEPVGESRAFGVWARTLEILRYWGHLDALLEAGTFYPVLRPVDARTEWQMFSFDFGVLDDTTAVQGVMLVPQNVTEGVLRGRVRARPECEVWIAEFVGLEQDEEGMDVRVRERGLRGEPREAVLRARYVVGCDGARSAVRKALGLKLEGKTYPTRMVVSDERVAERGLGHLRVPVRWPGFAAGLRFAPDLWRIFAMVPEGMGDEEAVSEAAHEARVRAIFGDRPHETVWASQFRIYRRHARRFRVGRVLLAGDAAHLNSPAGGQGMNSGIQDAENAAWKLAEALRGGADTERLLDSYDRERREAVVAQVEKNSERNSRIEFGVPVFLKPLLFRAIAAAARVRPVWARVARNFSMLDLRYTDSPLLIDDHRLVGGRLDDARMDGERRVSDLLGGRAGVLAFGAAELGEEVGCVPVYHADEAPRRWGLRGPSCVIVRPDRHAGAVVENPTPERVGDAVRGALGRGSSPRRELGEPGDRETRPARL